jgi:uncharacterized alkaline shock family protein YloU
MTLQLGCSQEVSLLTTQEEFIPTELGNIRIADDVVAIIAGLAATEVEGVAGMSGGLAGGIADMLGGKRNLSKGVKVEVGDKQAVVDLYIVVKFGARIPDVAWGIQESVKRAIESMTGLDASKVNVHVQGVSFDTGSVEVEDDEARVR